MPIIPISTTLVQVSVGSVSNIWGVDASDNIYRYARSGSTWTPTQIAGGLKQVSVGADGTVWGVNAAGNIYRWDTGINDWTLIPGGLVQVSVGSASQVWGVNAAGNIYQYTGTGPSGWTMIAGGLKQVSVASDGTVWGVNANGNIYQYAGNNAWILIPGHGRYPNLFQAGPGTFTLVTVGSASIVYALDPSDQNVNLYRYTGDNTNPWYPENTSTMTSISISSDFTYGVIDQGVTSIWLPGPD